MNYSTHRIRYYAPFFTKGGCNKWGQRSTAWQQKCSKDWTDSDEYLGETMRCGLKREDRIATSTSMLVDAKGDEEGAA